MAAPVTPSRTAPLFNAATTALPYTFRATCVDADQANTAVYLRLKTPARKLITIVPMVRSGSDYTYAVRAPGTSHVINFKVTGTPASGYWTASLFGASVVIPWNASAADIQTALEALPDINAGDVLVSGRMVETGGVTITMRNNRAGVGYLMHTYLGWWAVSNIRNSAGTTLTTTRTIVTQGTGDLPNVGNGAHQDWYWDAISVRNGVYAGDTTDGRQAATGGDWPFWYSAAPALTVTRPTAAQVFTGTAPLFQWTLDLTNSSPIVYQEINYVDAVSGDSVFFWATDPVRPDGTTPSLPSGVKRVISGDTDTREYRLPHGILRNTKSYRAGFRVINTAGQEAFTNPTFSIAFTPPAAVSGFTGTPSTSRSYIDFSWTASAVSNFTNYEIRYRAASGTWGDSSDTRVWPSDPANTDAATQATTSYRSLEIPFGTDIVVGHFVRTTVVGEELISVAAEWTPPGGRIDGRGMTVISQTVPGNRAYAILPYRRLRSLPRNFTREPHTPWGRALPVVLTDRAFDKSLDCSYPILWDTDPNYGTTYRATLDALDTLCQTTQTLLYRDAMGERFYCVIMPPLNVDEDEEFRYSEIGVKLLQQDPPGDLQ